MLIVNEEKVGLIVDLELAQRMIESLVFVIKSVVVPTRSIEYLGLILRHVVIAHEEKDFGEY